MIKHVGGQTDPGTWLLSLRVEPCRRVKMSCAWLAVCCLTGWSAELMHNWTNWGIACLLCRAMAHIYINTVHNKKQQAETTYSNKKQKSSVAKSNLYNWKPEPSDTSETLFIALWRSGGFDFNWWSLCITEMCWACLALVILSQRWERRNLHPFNHNSSMKKDKRLRRSPMTAGPIQALSLSERMPEIMSLSSYKVSLSHLQVNVKCNS